MPGQSNCSLEGSREQFVVLGNIEHHIGWTVFCHAVHLTILERSAGVVPESKQIGACRDFLQRTCGCGFARLNQHLEGTMFRRTAELGRLLEALR